MLQFPGGAVTTTAAFPDEPFGQGAAAQVAGLGPSYFSTGVLLNVQQAPIDLQLIIRDAGSPGAAWAYGEVQSNIPPSSLVYPKALGFRARSHIAATPATITGQVWESMDGPLPLAPYPNLSFGATGNLTIIDTEQQLVGAGNTAFGPVQLPLPYNAILLGAVFVPDPGAPAGGGNMDIQVTCRPILGGGASIQQQEIYGFAGNLDGLYAIPLYGTHLSINALTNWSGKLWLQVVPATLPVPQFDPMLSTKVLDNNAGIPVGGNLQAPLNPYDGDVIGTFENVGANSMNIFLTVFDYQNNNIGDIYFATVAAGATINMAMKLPHRRVMSQVFGTAGDNFHWQLWQTPRRGGS